MSATEFIGNIYDDEIVDRARIDCVKRVTGTAARFDLGFLLSVLSFSLLEVRGELNSDSRDATDREKMWFLRDRVT